jgi:hypothetical protein
MSLSVEVTHCRVVGMPFSSTAVFSASSAMRLYVVHLPPVHNGRTGRVIKVCGEVWGCIWGQYCQMTSAVSLNFCHAPIGCPIATCAHRQGRECDWGVWVGGRVTLEERYLGGLSVCASSDMPL